MTDTDRMTAEEIERDIEKRRASLGRTIDELQSRASLDNLFSGFGESLQEQGAEIGRTVSQTVRKNPAAVALTGIGLAWLTYSLQQNAARDRADEHHVDPVDSEFRPARFRPVDDPGEDMMGHELSADPWGVELSDEDEPGLAQRARDKAGEMTEEARRQLHGARRRVDRGWRSARAQAVDLRARLMDGTEDLSAEARARVAEARLKALEAQHRIEAAAAEGGRKARNFYHEHPLAVGLMAAAAGAAIAAMLPRTEKERQTLGGYRDRVFAEAEKIYREERARALRAARKAGDEALDVAREAKDSALGSGASPDTREAVSRVARAAREAAQNDA